MCAFGYSALGLSEQGMTSHSKNASVPREKAFLFVFILAYGFQTLGRLVDLDGRVKSEELKGGILVF